MLDNFETIDMFKVKYSSNIFRYFKTTSPKFNVDVRSTLNKFKKLNDLLKNLAKIETKFIFSNLEELKRNISDIYYNDEFNLSYHDYSSSEKFVTDLSKIYFSINLISKIKEILNNILTSTKNYFTSFSLINKYKFKNQVYISNYLDNLLFFVSNKEITTPKFSVLSSSSLENDSTYCSNKDESNSFSSYFKYESNQKNLPVKIYDKTSEEKENPNKKLKRDSQKAVYLFPDEDEENPERKFSKLSFAKMGFIENETSKKPSPVKRMKSLHNYEIKNKNKEDCEGNIIRKIMNNFQDKAAFKELLELVKYLYKNCLINSEEKLKIKQMIFSRSKKIQKIYVDYFISKKYNRTKLVSELKTIIQ